MRHFSSVDRFLNSLDNAIRTVWGQHHSHRPAPVAANAANWPSAEARKLAGALMRVNHVGEVCAQALYQAQAAATPSAKLRALFEAAAREEEDHLAWTQARVEALGTYTSRLNPLWYAGACGLGWLAGKAGDAISLGFVVETERQVEAHLASHLDRLPKEDSASRAIVEQMKLDEARHALEAQEAGAKELPAVVKGLMHCAGKVMTTTARWV
jgi:ubiquinone biosynthesis monooxygenase Coq7